MIHKLVVSVAVGLICPLAAAQWGGFLDPNIIQQAGETAATGNLELNNLNIGGDDIDRPSRTPTAAEVAQEILRQQDMRRQQEASRQQAADWSRIERTIRSGYAAEFGR